MFACPQGTSRLQLDGFSLGLMSENFSKFCVKNQSDIESNKNNVTFHEDIRTFFKTFS